MARPLERLARLPDQIGRIVRHPLNRGRASAAMLRWGRWQMKSRLSPGLHVVSFVNGTRLHARAGMAGVTGNIYYGFADYEEMAFFGHFLRPDELFADVGANVGAYSVLACGAIGARTAAFEPIGAAADMVEANARLNGIEDLLVLHRAAVGEAPGTVRMTADRDTGNKVVADGSAKGPADVDVPVVTLDAVFTGEIPVAMKIDVEGYTAKVLAGAQTILTAPGLQALTVEIFAKAGKDQAGRSDLFAMVTGFGFTAARYDPRSRVLTAIGGPNTASDNTIFVKNIEVAAERLRTAPALDVNGQMI
jgi:FkbM family methyltransferase